MRVKESRAPELGTQTARISRIIVTQDGRSRSKGHKFVPDMAQCAGGSNWGGQFRGQFQTERTTFVTSGL